MEPGHKSECLRHLTFGNQIAEEERDALKEYFVRTQAWNRILNGEVDIVYGPKGSGKSALYVLSQDHADELFDNNVLQIAAENPRGTPAFRDLEVDPPASEREFTSIWKLYFLLLVARALDEYGIRNAHSTALFDALKSHGLLPAKRSALGSILKSVRSYVSRMMKPGSVEGGMAFDPTTGMPNGFTGKILFRDPEIEEERAGFVSVDDLLAQANTALDEAGYDAWLMLDRLDVAFDDSSDLERNALRALFRAYRDNRSQDRIKPKIFLRTDIWKRITEEGFREATHMSRDINLVWDRASIKNLIVRRLLSNQKVVELYNVEKDKVLLSTRMQDEFFDRVFPDQVEVGENQSTTLNWLMKRTADGTKLNQPRDLILFLNKLVEVQNRRIERGENEPTGTWLFDRSSFKEALPGLSEYKVTRQLFAEYPSVRKYIEALREQKTEHNVDSLSRVWKVSEEEATSLAKVLRNIGFFEERQSKGETTYWVPFVYRSYLALSQGKMQELQNGNFVDLSQFEYLFEDLDDEEPQSA
ncbi:P-loop ATPase, Sll1717 family [Rhizobium ruizarguesonis]